MDGIVNFLKPTGLTSSQAIGRVKRAFGRRDVGHLGTLDPFAAGVLPVAVGKATKLFDLYLQKTKTYRALMKFGFESDTWDSSGTVTRRGVVPTDAQVAESAQSIVGTYAQIPPSYSAKSINGVRAYDLARKGIKPDLQPKTITIFRCDAAKSPVEGVYAFDIECSAGTYIRSVVKDMADKMNAYGILVGLIRTASGPWRIDNAVTETELFVNPEACLKPLSVLLQDLPRVDVSVTEYKKIANGVPIKTTQFVAAPFTVFCNDELFGLGRIKDGQMTLDVYLHE